MISNVTLLPTGSATPAPPPNDVTALVYLLSINIITAAAVGSGYILVFLYSQSSIQFGKRITPGKKFVITYKRIGNYFGYDLPVPGSTQSNPAI